MNERERRQAKNEGLFRSVNERIEDLAQTTFSSNDGAAAYDFVCECADKSCTERVALTVREYETVRASGHRFIVAASPAHVDTSIENVVDISSRYWIVEKIDAAAEQAERDDPRA